ncbi:MAG: Hsp20/alpha crystallin family protein [Peptococcia bacterium]
MSLIPWNPFKDMDNIGREMSSFFENSPFAFLGRATSPRVDVYQTETDVIVKVEIPGVSKEDLNVYIDENSIRLSGQTISLIFIKARLKLTVNPVRERNLSSVGLLQSDYHLVKNLIMYKIKGSPE